MIHLESESPAQAASDIRRQGYEASNVLGSGLGLVDRFNAYLTWAARATAQLAQHLDHRQLNELVTTPRYWSLQGVEPIAYGPALSEVLNNELIARQAALDAAAQEIDAAVQKWGRYSAVVLDTNVFLEIWDLVERINWNRKLGEFPHVPIALVLTSKMLEEIDNLKDRAPSQAARRRAREATKYLENEFPRGQFRQLRGEAWGDMESALGWVLHLDALEHQPLPKADSEILSQALKIRPYAAGIAIASNDSNMRFTARSYNLTAFTVNADEVLPDSAVQ
ncbi:PIN domain-containing protein [Salinibacterium soli]|uniref:PIN domain-containing protein n=1 Tax=Antiquaquibacter soli TaxID=3064523 RepID=A0ABT9BTJ2_9MICO|nr:PIN domain-containing protein [Protaetiibacter sp. WY-16]MDO7883121.1 PIN domain-containing protein [Protaetiibacter sp. WY-16]